MKTIIVGTADFHDYAALCAAIEKCGWTPTEVVTNTAHGVAVLGDRWAKAHGVPVRVFPADNDTHGRKSGKVRNLEMVEYAEAIVAILDGHGRSVRHLLVEANKRHQRVYVHRPLRVEVTRPRPH